MLEMYRTSWKVGKHRGTYYGRYQKEMEMRGRNRKHTEVSVGTIVINQNTRADAQMQCLEVVYNHQGLHALCFTQMCLRSNHRRDLMAAIGATLPYLLYWVVLSTLQNVSSGLSTVSGQQDMKCIRQYCKCNIVDAFTHSLLCICHTATATYGYKNPPMQTPNIYHLTHLQCDI